MQRKCGIVMTLCLMLFFTMLLWPAVSTSEDNDNNVRWERAPEGKPVVKGQTAAVKNKVRNEAPPGATIDGQPIPGKLINSPINNSDPMRT